jgi:hypothetical integral membrane protein (TIGR02206 family)
MTLQAADEFTTFSTSHWVMIALFLVGIPVAVALGRAVRDTGRELVVSRVFAVAIPCFTVPLQVIDFLPGNYSLQTTLPLQLCDLGWMAATVALWTRHRFFVALAYFWGLLLTTQALLTPALASPFPDPKFIAFWGMHYLIIWAAIYLVWGLGLSPAWRDYATTVAATLVWLVAVFTVNGVLGTNYGFVNRKPPRGSVLDYLGPWPTYVLVEILVIAIVWALMTWPWVRRRSQEASRRRAAR